MVPRPGRDSPLWRTESRHFRFRTVTNAVVKIQDSSGTPNPMLLAHGGSAPLLIVLAGGHRQP